MIPNVLAVTVIMLATIPLTIGALRFARKHRKLAYAGTALLLLFGIGMRIDPPPPPPIEVTEREEEETGDEEPE